MSRPPLTDTALPASPIQPVGGLNELAGRYSLLLCDVWGVLHNGLAGFPQAGDALTRFREAGGRVVLVSNAPRPGPLVARQLDTFGTPRSAYDDVVTSGDVTRLAIAARAGQTVFHLGPERDLALFEGLDARFADIDECDYVVCTGLFDDEQETVSDYAPMLARFRERGLTLLCANPDIVVERGASLIPCAGAIAAAYELLDGETYTGGKPHRPIYEAAVARASELLGVPADLSRVLAVGDALRTDVAGGRAFGIDTLMIARGIHAEELGAAGDGFDVAAALAWLERQPVKPDLLLHHLAW